MRKPLRMDSPVTGPTELMPPETHPEKLPHADNNEVKEYKQTLPVW